MVVTPAASYTEAVDDRPFFLVALDSVRSLIGGTIWLGLGGALVIAGDTTARIVGLVMLAVLAVPASIGFVRWRHGKRALR